jgi:hypothetical protein
MKKPAFVPMQRVTWRWGKFGRLRFFFWLAVFFPGLMAPAWGTTESHIDAVQVRVEGAGVYVDARAHIELSEPMRDALEKGVSLYFVATVKVKRVRWYWFDAVEVDTSKVMRLSYVPLFRQYRVTVDTVNQTFYDLPAALGFLGVVDGWHIADGQLLEMSGRRKLIFSFELDDTKLPRILQLGVVNDQAWRLKLTREVGLPRGQ